MVTLVNKGKNAYIRTDNARKIDNLMEKGWQVVSEVKPPQSTENGAGGGEKSKTSNRAVQGAKTPKKAKSGNESEG